MDTPVNTHSTSQALQASLYFWWLAFLRCSKDYWWCCQQRGQCQDDRLVRVWQDFGDIHQPKRMMQWWQGHGARLFVSPQIEMEFVKILASGIEFLLDQDLSHPRPGMLCVAIPLSLEAQPPLNPCRSASCGVSRVLRPAGRSPYGHCAG